MVQKSQRTTWDGAKTMENMGFQLPFPQLVSRCFFHQQYLAIETLANGGCCFVQLSCSRACPIRSSQHLHGRTDGYLEGSSSLQSG